MSPPEHAHTGEFHESLTTASVGGKSRSRLLSLLKIALSCALLFVAFHIAPVREVAAVLGRADAAWAATGIAMSLLERVSAAGRTQSLSRALMAHITRWQTMTVMFIASFWSLFIPGLIAGSVVSARYYRNFGISTADALGMLAASRVIEIAGYAVLILAGLAASSLGAFWSWMGAGVALLAIGGVTMIAVGLAPLRSWLRSRSSPTATLCAKLANALSVMLRLSPSQRMKSLAWALVQGLLAAGCLAAMAAAVSVDLVWRDVLLMSCFVYFAGILPVSVAGLGLRELTLIVLFAACGLPADAALATGLLLLFATLVNSGLGGVLQAPRRHQPR